MKTKITILKTLLLVFAITSSITVQAQDSSAVLHLQFENNLNSTGGFTFEANDPGSIGFTIPFSSTNFAEGSYALDFSSIDNGTVDVSLIQNGDAADIRSTTNLGITGNSARTVSVWVRYDDKNPDTNGSHCIVNLGDPASATQGRNTFTLAAANDKLQLAIGGGNANHEYAGSNIEDGNWHHVAFTLTEGGDMSGITFYVDGVAVSSDGGNNSNAIATTDDLVYIGSRGNNTQKWFDGGGIDDLRIYDYELSETEMATVYNGGYLSIEDEAFEANELKAYPNAVVDFLYIETTNNSALDITVFDLAGRVIIRTYGKRVDMRGLAPGLYVVKVREDNKVGSLKILKE